MLQTVDVKLDGFADEPERLFARLAYRHTAGQVRAVRSPARFSSLNDHQVTHVLCDSSKPGHRNQPARFEAPSVQLDALDFS